MRAAPDEIEHGVEEDDGRAADAVHESVAELGGDEAQEDGGEADADVERPEVGGRRDAGARGGRTLNGECLEGRRERAEADAENGGRDE